VTIEHIPKADNEEANQLAQTAFGDRRKANIFVDYQAADDWRKEIVDYLKDPSQWVSRKVRYKNMCSWKKIDTTRRLMVCYSIA
jgi:hypothetical protein